jgi:hypothetical protein
MTSGAEAKTKSGTGARVAGRETKRCPRCEAVLPIASFGVDSHRGDGRHAFCRPCHRAYRRERARQNPERERATQVAYYEANKPRRLAASGAWNARARQVRAALEQGMGFPHARERGFVLAGHAPSGRVAALPHGTPVPERFAALCEVLPLAGECAPWPLLSAANRDAAEATARIARRLLLRSRWGAGA